MARPVFSRGLDSHWVDLGLDRARASDRTPELGIAQPLGDETPRDRSQRTHLGGPYSSGTTTNKRLDVMPLRVVRSREDVRHRGRDEPIGPADRRPLPAPGGDA